MASLTQKTMHVLKTEGLNGVMKHTRRFLNQKKEAKKKLDATKDILFINGCDPQLLPHPVRYRITHQREQLMLQGYTTDEIFYKAISQHLVYQYRAFVIFRCVYTKELDQFIQIAKKLNKTVFYDIDDLVIDTCYTNQIEYVKTMDNKEQYDLDVQKMGQLLSMCDAAITTTNRLQKELSHYIQPVIINRNVASIEMVQLSQAVKKEEHQDIRIGYFSGSITHNEDFQMIYPVLKEILDQYSNVTLHVCGELEVNDPQIVVHPFMDYRKLPQCMAQMDINLAPLKNSIFNEAKSEIKWIEASLVKVCTIASDIGAFQQIQNEKTGLLCHSLEDWKTNLIRCIESKTLRETLANQAYEYCLKYCTTMYSSSHFVHQIQSILHPNICFAMPKVQISGGIMVALKHMSILQEAGYDVSILSLYDTDEYTTYEGYIFPILSLDENKINFHIDQAIATMWVTIDELEKIQGIQEKKYLVQNYETDFYSFKDPLKIKAQKSYNPRSHYSFLTISKWCQNWLKNDFYKEAKYAPNGIESNRFYPAKRDWNGKIRILIEGDCQAEHKNVDESFEIVKHLNPEHFEIWYMSYNARPKEWYRVDKFLHQIPFEQVADIYRQCHILIKTSVLESFSYPPLEMMATGGLVLALANEGNVEYLKHNENCLFYEKGNIQEALSCIEQMINNENLRLSLIEKGIQTAKNRDWNTIQDQVLNLYR
ncbi:glycosyltransferase [Floccifex sp.]|uniref:glycosyltransferase n=1 Tax=Floccifex sp. TaxID=2815810 RepID=UPI003F08ADD7